MTTCARRIARGGWYEDVALQRCRFPIGPWSTWSNLAYPLGALLVLALDRTPAAMGFAIAMAVLGAGSFAYHGWKTLWANRLDWLGIWAVFGALVAHPLAPDAPTIGWIMAGAALLGGTLLVFAFRQVGANALIGLFLVMAALPVFWTSGWRLALLSFAVFGLGKLFWQAGKATGGFGPVWFRRAGHGNWHVTTTVAFVLMFLAQTHLRGVS